MQNRANSFIETLDGKFRMINRDDLLAKLKGKDSDKTLVIDFRDKSAFVKSRIRGSVNVDIKKLSHELDGIDKNKEIIAVCNGSIQSGYAIFYLYLNGYDKVYNLSGGFSGCIKNNFSLIEFNEELMYQKN